jgi:hypothetical protein
MFRYIKRIFNKQVEDKDINQLIETEPKEWTNEWKTIHQKNKDLDSLSLDKYLKESPGKEDLFLNRLRLKAVASEMETQKNKGASRLVLRFGLIMICLISVVIWVYPTAKTEKEIDYTLRIRDFSGKISLVRNNKKIEFLSVKELLKDDAFEIKNPSDSFTIESSEFIIFKMQGPAYIELKEIPSLKNEISFYIHKGIISIDSKPSTNKPIVYWNTKHFTYTPLGTIAKLVVLNGKESLKVDKGSFSISNHETGTTEITEEGASFEKEVVDEELEVPVSKTDGNESYGILQTVTLKNGNKYTGYFYRSGGKVWIQTEKEKLEFKEEEIETLE